MERIKKQKNRQTLRRRKRRQKLLIIISGLILLLTFQMYRQEKRAEAKKKIEIGGPKIELKLNQVADKKQPTHNSSPAVNSIVELTSRDRNVRRAYTDSTWQPTATEQKEPHWINLTEGSLDRRELRETILKVTDMPDNELIEWWLSGEDNDKIIATVSNEDVSKIYRLYLVWQTNQGWLVEKMEELKNLPDFE